MEKQTSDPFETSLRCLADKMKKDLRDEANRLADNAFNQAQKTIQNWAAEIGVNIWEARRASEHSRDFFIGGLHLRAYGDNGIGLEGACSYCGKKAWSMACYNVEWLASLLNNFYADFNSHTCEKEEATDGWA